MRTGKISVNVLRRSVLKTIQYKSARLLLGPMPGEDCARLDLKGCGQLLFTGEMLTGEPEVLGQKAFYRMVNDITASGAVPSGMVVNLLLPADLEEDGLKQIMGELGELAAQYRIDILGGHTEVTEALSEPVLSLTGTGFAKRDSEVRSGGLEPGDDIVMTKWAGSYGAAELVMEKERRAALRTRFREELLSRTEDYFHHLSCSAPEAAIALEAGARAMHNASSSGVFSALWEMGEASGTGILAYLKKIPIRQETVEVCEFFDKNPYMIPSDGVLLIGIPKGELLVTLLAERGIPAAVIGTATRNHDRVVVNNGERRFLG